MNSTLGQNSHADYFGVIRKMRTWHESPVRYALPIGDQELPLNACLGRRMRLRHTGSIFCLNCGVKTKSSFSQGHCFRCSQALASCDLCIVKPETCHFERGTCREPDWGRQHCFIPHVVYLANSSGVKVGITREHQRLTRWMDQGACQALPILRTANRKEAGLAEVVLARHMPDKTQWRALLKGEAERLDLVLLATEALTRLPESLSGYRFKQVTHAFASSLPAEETIREAAAREGAKASREPSQVTRPANFGETQPDLGGSEPSLFDSLDLGFKVSEAQRSDRLNRGGAELAGDANGYAGSGEGLAGNAGGLAGQSLQGSASLGGSAGQSLGDLAGNTHGHTGSPDSAQEMRFTYPVLKYPEKITSFNLDKNPWVEGELWGIKGQYLLFDTGVINIRKYGGYEMAVTLA